MGPRRDCICVDFKVLEVTCPGVWLCAKGKVFLRVTLLDSSEETKSIRPVFPLQFNQGFTFRKIVTKELQEEDLLNYLRDKKIRIELFQRTKDEGDGILLSKFKASIWDILYCNSDTKVTTRDSCDLLLSPSCAFPGLIGPMLGVAANVYLEDSQKTGYKIPQAVESTRGFSKKNPVSIRQRPVCHTELKEDCRCFDPDPPRKERRSRSQPPGVRFMPAIPDEDGRRLVGDGKTGGQREGSGRLQSGRRPRSDTRGNPKKTRFTQVRSRGAESHLHSDTNPCDCNTCQSYQEYFPDSEEVARKQRVPTPVARTAAQPPVVPDDRMRRKDVLPMGKTPPEDEQMYTPCRCFHGNGDSVPSSPVQVWRQSASDSPAGATHYGADRRADVRADGYTRRPYRTRTYDALVDMSMGRHASTSPVGVQSDYEGPIRTQYGTSSLTTSSAANKTIGRHQQRPRSPSPQDEGDSAAGYSKKPCPSARPETRRRVGSPDWTNSESTSVPPRRHPGMMSSNQTPMLKEKVAVRPRGRVSGQGYPKQPENNQRPRSPLEQVEEEQVYKGQQTKSTHRTVQDFIPKCVNCQQKPRTEEVDSRYKVSEYENPSDPFWSVRPEGGKCYDVSQLPEPCCARAAELRRCEAYRHLFYENLEAFYRKLLERAERNFHEAVKEASCKL